SVWLACSYNLLFMGLVGVVYVVFAAPLVHAFTTDAGVTPVAVRALRIISSGFLLYAYGIVLTQSFNGAGDTTTPTIINLFCFWLGEIPLAYLLARLAGWGPDGVFWSVAIALSALAAVSAAAFRRGRWKRRVV